MIHPSLKEIPQPGEATPNVNEGEVIEIQLIGTDEDDEPLSYFINQQQLWESKNQK